jgi:hypothetical protein
MESWKQLPRGRALHHSSAGKTARAPSALRTPAPRGVAHDLEYLTAWHLVASTRRLPTSPFHDPVEGFEIGPGLALLKEGRCLKCRNLFGHGRGDELVYAGAGPHRNGQAHLQNPSRSYGRHKKCNGTGSAKATIASTNTFTSSSLRPAPSRCSGRLQTASYSSASAPLINNVAPPCGRAG